MAKSECDLSRGPEERLSHIGLRPPSWVPLLPGNSAGGTPPMELCRRRPLYHSTHRAVASSGLARSPTARLEGSELSGQPESAHDDIDVAGQLSHSDVNVPAARCGEQEAGAELEARPVPV